MNRKHTRRSVSEQKLDMLSALRYEPTGPVHLMYRANISFQLIKHHLADLEGAGLISADRSEPRRVMWSITNTGSVIVSQWENVKRALTKESIVVDKPFSY